MILDAIIGAKRFAGQPGPLNDFWYQPVSTPSATGVSVTPDSAMQVATVYACVRVIAETAGSLPLLTYQELVGGGKRRATEHPLYSVLHDRPNKWQTPMEFVEMLTGHAALRGNGYAHIRPGRRGAVDELWPLHPDTIRVLVSDDNRINYEQRLPGRPPHTFVQDEIFHLRGMSSNSFTGLAPTELAKEPIGLAAALENHGATLFKNKAIPGGVLEYPEKITAEAARQRRLEMERVHAGSDNAHRTMILWDGMKWRQMGMTSEDAQFLESRKYQRIEICGIFRMQPHMIAELTDAHHTNIEQQSLEFVIHTMRPWFVRWEQAIKRDLIQDDDMFVEFLVDGLLRGDIKSRYDAYKIGHDGGWLSANEIRAFENKNPREGGDAFLTPLNMAVEGGGPEAEPPAAEGPTNEPDGIGARFAADAARRIAAAEIAELKIHVPKGADDRERFDAWAAGFLFKHEVYVRKTLGVIGDDEDLIDDVMRGLRGVISSSAANFQSIKGDWWELRARRLERLILTRMKTNDVHKSD